MIDLLEHDKIHDMRTQRRVSNISDHIGFTTPLRPMASLEFRDEILLTGGDCDNWHKTGNFRTL